MNTRAFAALTRREISRGKRKSYVALASAAVALVLTLLLNHEAAVAVGAFALMGTALVLLGPLSDLRRDKLMGDLEFDRVLPVSLHAIGAARFLGALVRTMPVLALALPLIVAVNRDAGWGAGRIVFAVAAPIAGWLVLTAMLWAVMAINIRWNLRRLWWLPMTIAFGPRIAIDTLPPAARERVGDAVSAAGTALVAWAATGPGVAILGAVFLLSPVVFFALAVALFATGLDRYNYDEAASLPSRTAAPKRELGAIGRGPTLAVARYCIRLATEQSRRRFVVLALFVVVMLVGTADMKAYGQFYVRALAALLPGAVTLQLSTARARGYLEGLQQLPHPARLIGAGHLLAIIALGIPGAAVWILARAVNGIPPTPTNVLSLYAWLVVWVWMSCVATVWLTQRRMLMLAAAPLGVFAVAAAYRGPAALIASLPAAAAEFTTFRQHTGVVFPLLLATLAIGIGVPLFGRSLAEFQPGLPKQRAPRRLWLTR